VSAPASNDGPVQAQARLESWRLAQVVSDTYELSRVGGFLYLFGWIVIAAMAGVMVFAPVHALALAGGFLMLGLLRYWARPPSGADDQANRRWLRRYAVVLPLPSALWSVAQAWVLLDPRFASEMRMVSLVATIGYATVFANVYSTVRHLAVIGVCVLFVPLLAVLWSQPEDRALAIAVTFYSVYLAGALVRSHAEYLRRLRLDQALRDQRDQFEQLSRTDALTGLYNRRHFTAHLDQAAQRAREGGAGFTMLVLDVDHFKRVNDLHGHVVGDACLKALADRLQRAFPPPAALLARLGGEEFGVLFQGSVTDALAAAEALRHDLVMRPLECEGRHFTITVSVGVGAFDAAGHADGDGLYRAVDMALYQAKSQGRNRVQSVAVSAEP
jgi:diguanylate cyclase (GGDEF)-like protein